MEDKAATRQHLIEFYERSIALGMEEVVLDDYIYKVDGEEIVFQGYVGEDEKLIVPDWFDRVEVCDRHINAKVKEVEFGDAVKVIGKIALISWYHIERIKAPGVVCVCKDAFSGLTNLQTVEMENLEVIEDNAFLGCEKLKSITMDRVKIIGFRAMSETGLVSISLPSLEKARNQAFADNQYLTRVVLPVHRFKPSPFMFCECFMLSEVMNSEVMEIIPQSMFYNCKRLRQINLRARNIAVSAFEGCVELKHIRIYNRLVNVNQRALQKYSQSMPPNRMIPCSTYGDNVQQEHKTMYQQHIENIKKGRFLW